MNIALTGCRLLPLLFVLIAAPGWALTVDQVLKLRKAGVSDTTIRQMIENEIAAAKAGTTGVYEVQSGKGRSVIVYSAKSAKGGAGNYEVNVSEQVGNPDRISTILGQPRRANAATLGIALQLGSFRSAAEARALADKLLNKKLEAKTMRVDLGEKGIWYRVLIDGFNNKGQAQTRGEALRKSGVINDFWVGN